MEEIRRKEIYELVKHFEGKLVNQNVITEYCNLSKITPITMGDFTDYKYQIAHDEKVIELFPKVLTELQKLQYLPEFGRNKKEVEDINDEVRVNITKIFEDAGINYKTVDTLGQELGRIVGGAIEGAGTTAFNKALQVLLHLASKHFGGEFNMQHARDYTLDVIGKAKDLSTVAKDKDVV